MPEALRLPGYSSFYVSYLSTALPTRTIAGITVPTTPFITASIEFARAHLNDWAFNHALRSWLLGFAISDRLPAFANRDRELHSIAAILHVVRWSEKGVNISNAEYSEADATSAVRIFLGQQTTSASWSTERKQLLWNAMAPHTVESIASENQAEVKATMGGTLTDIRGPDKVPEGALLDEEWRHICEAFPRSGLPTSAAQKLLGLYKDDREA